MNLLDHWYTIGDGGKLFSNGWNALMDMLEHLHQSKIGGKVKTIKFQCESSVGDEGWIEDYVGSKTGW